MSGIQYTSVLDTNIHRPVPVSDIAGLKKTLSFFDQREEDCSGLRCLNDLTIRASNAFEGTPMGKAALTEILGLRMDSVYNTKVATVRLERLEQRLNKNNTLRNEAYSQDEVNVLDEEKASIEREIAEQVERINFYKFRK